jgi:hypothetical protein
MLDNGDFRAFLQVKLVLSVTYFLSTSTRRVK